MLISQPQNRKQMRNHDAATDPHASYSPRMNLDTPADLIHEPFAEYQGPLPVNRQQWHALTRELVEQGVEQADIGESSQSDARRVACEMLRLISADEDKRFAIRATLYGRLLGIEGRSIEEIGQSFGLTRASVSHTYRQIKALHPGISNPADKAEDYCQEAAERRRGKRKERDGTDRRHVCTLRRFFIP
jgi:hypothetical protein